MLDTRQLDLNFENSHLYGAVLYDTGKTGKYMIEHFNNHEHLPQ